MKARSIVRVTLVLIASLATGCSLPVPGASTPEASNPDYTAAVQTIAAQMTQNSKPADAISTAPLTPAQPTPGLIVPAASETLPDTSTPLPTRTPLPSNPLTESRTPTSTILPSNTAGPTVSLNDPKSGLGDPDFKETFTDGSNWFVYSDEHVTIAVQNHQLAMTALKADKYEAMMLSTLPILEDFYMEARITTGACSGLDRYGLILRAPGFSPIQGYLLGFTCDGKYSLRTWDGSTFAAIIPWTPSDLIQSGPDQTNTMGFSAAGQILRLFANGNLLIELQDDRYSSGYFGLFSGAYSTANFSVTISDFSYWLIP